MNNFLKILRELFLIFYSILVKGFLAYKAYYWFILPSLPLFPQFTYLQMVGIMTAYFLAFYKFGIRDMINDEYKNKYLDLVSYPYYIIILPWAMLGICYIVHLFI